MTEKSEKRGRVLASWSVTCVTAGLAAILNCQLIMYSPLQSAASRTLLANFRSIKAFIETDSVLENIKKVE